MDRERDPRFRTADRVLIVDGLRVWDYDRQPGTVCFAESHMDSEWGWDGWFQVLRDGGGMKAMNGERLCTVDPFDRSPVPAFTDDRAEELCAALDAGAVLTVDFDPVRQRCPVLEWAPRVATDPQPWRDTLSRWRYSSAEVTPSVCDYCDRPATLYAKDSDEVLCETDARDHYADWRDATRALAVRDIAARLNG